MVVASMVVGVHSDTLSSSRDVRPSMVIPCVTVSFPKRNHAVPAPWFWRGEEGGREGGIPSSANIEQVPIIKHLSPSTEIRPLKTIQLRNINLPWRAPSPKKCRCGGDYPGVRDEWVSGNEPECLGVGRCSSRMAYGSLCRRSWPFAHGIPGQPARSPVK